MPRTILHNATCLPEQLLTLVIWADAVAVVSFCQAVVCKQQKLPSCCICKANDYTAVLGNQHLLPLAAAAAAAAVADVAATKRSLLHALLQLLLLPL